MSLISRTIGSPRATRLFFDCVGPTYRWLTNNPMWIGSLHEIARHLPPSAAQLTLLDVGCGHGNSAQQFVALRPDLRVLGLDFSLNMLKMARRATRGKSAYLFSQADVTRLPLPDNSVDAITGHSVYYMLEDRPAFLREAMRVLRPGGRLILLDPAARRFPLEMIPQVRRMRIALAVMLWHGVSRMHDRFTLEQMADQLQAAGFSRILTEKAVEGYGVLSRGEKPFAPKTSTESRIAQTAALDRVETPSIPITSSAVSIPSKAAPAIQQTASGDFEVIRTSEIPEQIKGKFVFLLVKQTPDKPAWKLEPDEWITWEAATVMGKDGQRRLLVFTSLPKAVEFMQPAVKSGALFGVNKVAKFDKSVAPDWLIPALLNPHFLALHKSGAYRFNAGDFLVDYGSSVKGEE